jgi:hypothetical protein
MGEPQRWSRPTRSCGTSAGRTPTSRSPAGPPGSRSRPAPSEPVLDRVDMDKREVRDLARDPDVRAIAPVMPTALVRPVSDEDARWAGDDADATTAVTTTATTTAVATRPRTSGPTWGVTSRRRRRQLAHRRGRGGGGARHRHRPRAPGLRRGRPRRGGLLRRRQRRPARSRHALRRDGLRPRRRRGPDRGRARGHPRADRQGARRPGQRRLRHALPGHPVGGPGWCAGHLDVARLRLPRGSSSGWCVRAGRPTSRPRGRWRPTEPTCACSTP